MSASGFSIAGTDLGVQVGDRVFVEVFPDQNSSGSILLQAEVARIATGANNQDSVGLRIVKMSQFTEKQMRKTIEKLGHLPAAPAATGKAS
jgi:hypothetical protein